MVIVSRCGSFLYPKASATTLTAPAGVRGRGFFGIVPTGPPLMLRSFLPTVEGCYMGVDSRVIRPRVGDTIGSAADFDHIRVQH